MKHMKSPGKAVKFALLAFVAVSIAAAAYKMTVTSEKAPAPPVETAAGPAAPSKAAIQTPAGKAKTKTAAGSKTAVVYYFYTNTRCSSCKAIEAYTKEAVAKNFTGEYKGWEVIFKGVNVEEEPDKHFVQDYWLNSKSVVVQKFAGDKPLKWGKLEKVWQLLGDKEAFIDYVTVETHKLLDEK